MVSAGDGADPENLRAIYGLIELSYPLERL